METISVIGVGRVGLPLALTFARAGFKVHGIDVNQAHVDTLKAGKVPFLEAGAEPLLRDFLGSRFFPSTDQAGVAESSAIILTLGTPVDEHMNPSFAQIERVLQSIQPHLRAGQLLVLRSTVSPGSTEYIRRHLERTTRLRVGWEIFLAFCPERIAQGNSIEEIPTIPQIVGADDPKSLERASALFQKITTKIFTTDTMSAELAKLFSNMYRYIDFAIANEFMMLAEQHGRNILEINKLVNEGYKRAGLKLPGFTGGPCLYKDGFFLLAQTPFCELISTAWMVNESVPAYLIQKMKEKRPLEGKTVAVLGMAFKKNNDDTRNSLSFKAKKILQREGCTVLMHDPFLPSPDLDEVLRAADAILVATNHDAYKEFGFERLKARGKRGALVCDVWNVFGTGQTLFEL